MFAVQTASGSSPVNAFRGGYPKWLARPIVECVASPELLCVRMSATQFELGGRYRFGWHVVHVLSILLLFVIVPICRSRAGRAALLRRLEHLPEELDRVCAHHVLHASSIQGHLLMSGLFAPNAAAGATDSDLYIITTCGVIVSVRGCDPAARQAEELAAQLEAHGRGDHSL